MESTVTVTSSSEEYQELVKRLEKKIHNEKKLKGDLAAKKQMISMLETNEKHMEEHITQLEKQINTLVNEYEAKLHDQDEGEEE